MGDQPNPSIRRVTVVSALRVLPGDEVGHRELAVSATAVIRSSNVPVRTVTQWHDRPLAKGCQLQADIAQTLRNSLHTRGPPAESAYTMSEQALPWRWGIDQR